MDPKTFIRDCFDFPNFFVHILFQSTIYSGLNLEQYTAATIVA